MGTKYSTILVGGVVQTYNDSPPADDGSQTEANRVKYVTITGDLSAPLHSAITRMDGKLADHVDEGPTPKAATYITVLADHNSVIECTGTFTLSLLNPTGNAGYQVTAKNAGTGTITVNVDGGANVDGASSVSLTAGQAKKFYVNSGGTAYYSASNIHNEQHVNNADGGPYVSDTGFNITLNVTEDTWESVGPTGSGADNIWTALDSIADADWIEVKVYGTATASSSTNHYLTVFARENGSSVTPGIDSYIFLTQQYMVAGSSYGAINGGAKIPVNGNVVFDVYWDQNTTHSGRTISLYLTGYGKNS